MGAVRLALAEAVAHRQLARFTASPSCARTSRQMARGESARNCSCNANVRSSLRRPSRHSEARFARRLGFDTRVRWRSNDVSAWRTTKRWDAVSVLILALRAANRLERPVLQME